MNIIQEAKSWEKDEAGLNLEKVWYIGLKSSIHHLEERPENSS